LELALGGAGPSTSGDSAPSRVVYIG
jgi:hypothetical protein